MWRNVEEVHFQPYLVWMIYCILEMSSLLKICFFFRSFSSYPINVQLHPICHLPCSSVMFPLASFPVMVISLPSPSGPCHVIVALARSLVFPSTVHWNSNGLFANRIIFGLPDFFNSNADNARHQIKQNCTIGSHAADSDQQPPPPWVSQNCQTFDAKIKVSSRSELQFKWQTKQSLIASRQPCITMLFLFSVKIYISVE